MALLEVQDIHTYYGHVHALKGISFNVEEGSIVTLLGSNGAGKSTTLNTISGIVHPTQGEVLFNGQPIHKMHAHEIVPCGVIQVPEGRQIFRTLTVEENLDLGGFTVRDKSEVAKRKKRVYELFPRLKDRANQFGGTLSGGEQQMLAVGRAIIGQPKLLMLDEPSMGLAPTIVDQIMDLIKTINDEGITVLLVEQNARAALELATKGYVLETGQIVMSGSAEELRHDDRVVKAYLGM